MGSEGRNPDRQRSVTRRRGGAEENNEWLNHRPIFECLFLSLRTPRPRVRLLILIAEAA